MATSGNYDFNQGRNAIIKKAYIAAGIIDLEETPTPAQISLAADILNSMIKSWQGERLFIHVFSKAVLFPTQGVGEYTVSATGARICFESDFVETTLAIDALSADTDIMLTDPSGFAIGDNIGIANGNVLIWRTITDLASDIATLNTALGADIDANANIYSYTSKMPKPVEILDARVRSSGTTEIEMFRIAEYDYLNFPDKTTQSLPTQFAYKNNVSDGTLYIWAAPSDEKNLVKLRVQRQFQDFTTSADNPDFPIEWMDAIVFGLADRIGLYFGIDAQQYQRIKDKADESFGLVANSNNEFASIEADIERRGYFVW